MIMSASNRLRLIDSSGELHPFSSRDLCLDLLRSFLAAGLREESWVAEDIALAVEYTLERGSRESGIYSESELNAMVVKVLEQTGYPEVASRFSSSFDVVVVKYDTDAETLRPYLHRHLPVDDAGADVLAQKTAKALRDLGLESVTPVLAIELARALHDKAVHEVPEPAEISAIRGNTPWLLTAAQIVDQIPEAAKKLVDKEIISVFGVSRMFPALRIKCSFVSMAESEGLEPPITEMMLMPMLAEVSEVIDKTVEIAEKLAGLSSIPLVLEFDNAEEFGAKWLEMEYGSDAVTALSRIMLDMLRHKPFKIA